MLMLLIIMAAAQSGYAQQGRAQSIRVDAYAFRNDGTSTPYPGAVYGVVLSRWFHDLDDNNWFLDPGAVSRLNNVVLRPVNALLPGDLGVMGQIVGTAVSGYYINLNSPPIAVHTGQTQVYVHSLMTSERITVNSLEPFSPGRGITGVDALGGKHVYDIAEGIPARDCGAGDVVVINADEDMSVVKSSRRFDSKVAGVISGNPKVYMGPGDGKMALALAGVVKCKVSAENGAIEPGDLLVSSSTPGHAMSASARQVLPGMLVGKALEPLEKGRGEIFILVNKR